MAPTAIVVPFHDVPPVVTALRQALTTDGADDLVRQWRSVPAVRIAFSPDKGSDPVHGPANRGLTPFGGVVAPTRV